MTSRRLLTGMIMSAVCFPLVVSSSAVMAKPVTIRWMAAVFTPERLRMCKELIESFESKNPDLKVKFEPNGDVLTTVITQQAAGVTPDVIWAWGEQYWPMVESNLLMDLTPMFQSELKLDDFIPETVDGAKYKGRIYSVDGRPTAMFEFYNKQLFSESGLQDPNDLDDRGSWDKNSFLEAARKMTRDTNGDGKTDIWGYSVRSGAEYISGWIYSDGGTIFSPDRKKYTVNDSKTVRAVQFLVDLIYKHKVTSTPWKVDYSGFKQSKVAMIEAGAWDFGLYRAAKVDFDICQRPKGDIGRINSFLAGGAYWIMRGTKHQKEAWRFVKWLYGKEAQKIVSAYGEVPMTISGLKAPDFLKHPTGLPKHASVAYESMAGAKPYTYPPAAIQFNQKLNPIMDAIWNNKVTVSQGLDRAARELTSFLGTLKARR